MIEFSEVCMGRMLRVGLGIAVLFGVTVAAAGDEKFGKGVSLTEATAIKALYETPAKFVGKTIRIDGVVTAICEDMGCWMAIGETEKSEDTVRVKVGHDAGIVFPIKAKGRNVSAEGVFEKIAATDKEARNAADEHAAHAKVSDFGKTYQINVTGAIVR
jgi:hypothetical protein